MREIQAAIIDYRYLRERFYPARAALKLVGDRYELPAALRNLLFRGVVPPAEARSRRDRLVSAGAVRGRTLGVDWYNVVITVESYLKGVAVFLADDGVIRDAAAVHGSYRMGRLTDQATEALVKAVRAIGPAAVDIFLDAPVAFSGQMAAVLRSRLQGEAFAAAVEVTDSPDHALKHYVGIVATSDSAVMDCAGSVFDLARFALATAYGFAPPALEEVAQTP